MARPCQQKKKQCKLLHVIALGRILSCCKLRNGARFETQVRMICGPDAEPDGKLWQGGSTRNRLLVL
jgi:hypothetical protein